MVRAALLRENMNHAAIEYRAATPNDRLQWIALRFQLWPDCPMERHQLELDQLLKSDGVVAVADQSGELVGFAEVSIRGDHVEGTRFAPVPYLEGWYVKPGYRGKGIGRALVTFVEHWAVAHGFQEIASDAEIDNAQSVQLHVQLGFSEVGRTVHFVKQLR
jgi:aminoglycoside 6'-N-acetyltransferase I